MPPQNPKITVSPETKSLLDSKKSHPNETYENVILSSLNQPEPQSVGLQTSAVIGAGSGDEAFGSYSHTLRWIADTKKKMTAGGEYDPTPIDRETAFSIDPLISGIITPFLKNTLLGSGAVQTADNKKYSACIKDISQFLKDIQLLKIFRDDFEDYAIKHGHSYRRKDYIWENGLLKKLQRLEASAMTTYEDPWDSDIVAYHQRIYVKDIWSSTSASKMSETNSWFIPGGLKLIVSESIEEDGASAYWENFKKKYNIDETTGLRVGDSANIIAMHKVRPGKPAPIDNAILAIWLKRLILANAPNVILSVTNPFLHLKQGVMLKVPDGNGGEKLITSVPPAPPTDMATTDPERHSAMTANHSAYTTALETNVKNIMRYRAEGGLFASSPDIELVVTESGRTISANFIQMMIGLLDEEISRSVGFPLALISANGAELATSRTILELFNAAYAGNRQDYERVADELIEEHFEGESWDYEITLKDGTTESGQYTLEDTQAEFKLETGDVKDALKEAQTRLADMQALQAAKALGASKADIQAVLDEHGYGLWELDKFDTAGQPPVSPWDVQKPQEQAMQDKQIPEQLPEVASTITQDHMPEVIPKKEDEKLKDELMAAYQEARQTIEELMSQTTAPPPPPAPINVTIESTPSAAEEELTRKKIELVEAMKMRA